MGCLGIGLVALLALAVPASIARSSPVGAYVVIVVLAAIAGAAVVWRTRRAGAPLPTSVPGAPTGRRGSRTVLTWIGILALSYAVVVTIIHEVG